jgi:formate hydrogenlyase subunit 6/NADH:ubiquinone oxidoreductase subunit I
MKSVACALCPVACSQNQATNGEQRKTHDKKQKNDQQKIQINLSGCMRRLSQQD